ncbi:MAG TPA: hypothetical protein VLM91_21075 [Candidatus Methylomirabilis sp.]|nr:hypothetical protein [Candidatus Methylomirabilis sp.]
MKRMLRMALMIGMAGATVVAGCVAVHRETWRATDGRGAVSLAVCQFCSSPYGYQVKKAKEVMAAKCPGGYTVHQEGTTPSGEDARRLWRNPQPGEGGLGYEWIKYDQKWYWEFECTK